MKNQTRILTLLLVLILILQTFTLSASAITFVEIEVDNYAAGTQPSKYSSQYNSGQRDVVATTLNGTSADAYYNGSYEFDVLSEKSANEIKNALTQLMTSTHKKTSSYNDCRDMAVNTDCENEDGRVLLLYTSYSATRSEYNGWNREHVWPKSLGGNNTTGGGADLHHIRPSDAGVNSSRGNKKYGESGNSATEKYGTNPAVGILGGTYNSTYFEPLDNVKGDVARIVLYVWVRWGSAWGAESVTEVFQSVDLLLEWCELDPVDTWELGRNEVVEAYQGNRNVFIDYPEYAWLVFGRDVPDDMVTPSGEASGGVTGGGNTDGGNTGSGTTTPDPDVPETPKTEKEILDAAYALSAGETLDGTYTLTGVITALDNYNNPTIVVGDYTSQPMYCYRLVDSRFEIGATITVTGTIINYNGLIEMKDCTLDSIILPEYDECTNHVDQNEDYVCDNCGTQLERPTEPPIDDECTDHVDQDEDYVCDNCGTQLERPTEPPVDDECTDHVDQDEDYVCDNCGTQLEKPDDPDTPTPPTADKNDFTSIVTKLTEGIYFGKAEYTKICEALTLYSNLSDVDKEAVETQYTALKAIIANYNNKVEDMNSDANDVSSKLLELSVVAVTVLPFAALALLGKKYF